MIRGTCIQYNNSGKITRMRRQDYRKIDPHFCYYMETRDDIVISVSTWLANVLC